MLKTLLFAVGGVATLAVTAIISPPPKLVWNASASVPIGLYTIAPLRRPAIDSIILVEPQVATAAIENVFPDMPTEPDPVLDTVRPVQQFDARQLGHG